MALDPGTVTADAGMSAAIYQEMDTALSAPFYEAIAKAEHEVAKAKDEVVNAKDNNAKEAAQTGLAQEQKALAQAQNTLAQAQEGWKQLSYCIAKGVVDHIKANMEITGIQASGTVVHDTDVSTRQIAPTQGLVK